VLVSHSVAFFEETCQIAAKLDTEKVEHLVRELSALRERKGRLWLVGLGGSAANASHAANDFRKLCAIEAYCLTDNVAEFTARANDEGWAEAFDLDYAREGDALFVLSVGGGTQSVSRPINTALKNAGRLGVRILGIVGRDGGNTKALGDCVVVVPTVEPNRITPHTEGWQGVILHALVSHPSLQRWRTTW